ncbi:MAG: RNA pyrophosphohydrolase [Rhodospirillales bacterium]
MSAPPAGYRPCVGLMLVNPAGLVFVGRRDDTPDAWQMPQGGIDDGETPRQAALRELREETGTDRAEIVAESQSWLRYDLPAELRGRLWGGSYVGQAQKWFVLRFLGADADFVLDAHQREFAEWRWAPLDDLPRLIVPFKRAVYEAVVAEFRPVVASLRRSL